MYEDEWRMVTASCLCSHFFCCYVYFLSCVPNIKVTTNILVLPRVPASLVFFVVCAKYQSYNKYPSPTTRPPSLFTHVCVCPARSHEIVTQYDSGLATSATWTTDSNCREAQLRKRNWRANYTITPSEPVSSNYYPTNCIVKTSSPATTLAVAVDRSQGSTSLADGQLEIMVHRRMMHDDKRGVGA